jgi:hypothetical protein
MWERLCDHFIHKNSIKNKELCVKNNQHYDPELYKYYLYIFKTDKPTQYSFLMKNIFILSDQKELILQLYYEITLAYTRIRKCIRSYWVKRQPSCNLTDLSYTPFTEYKPDQYLCLLDGKNKYLFTHTDLYNIIEASLTNSDSNLISNPLSIKNPYTGTIFSKSTLYHIYFHIKHRPLFFIYYMKVHFDLTVFLLEQEGSLRQYSIHKKIRMLKKDEIKNELRYMFVDIYSFLLEDNFITEIILLQCSLSFSRELLTHYYNYTYSLNPYQRLCECKTLINKIKNMSNKLHKNILT